jgi:SHC-transforming protein 1
LVRESQGSQGQYVLTGMQSGHHKHLLLVDPEGVVSPSSAFDFFFLLFSKIIDKRFEMFFLLDFWQVRTKDRTFESVSHLINFHRNNVLPIISAESVLLLKRPVARSHHS